MTAPIGESHEEDYQEGGRCGPPSRRRVRRIAGKTIWSCSNCVRRPINVGSSMTYLPEERFFKWILLHFSFYPFFGFRGPESVGLKLAMQVCPIPALRICLGLNNHEVIMSRQQHANRFRKRFLNRRTYLRFAGSAVKTPSASRVIVPLNTFFGSDPSTAYSSTCNMDLLIVIQSSRSSVSS